MRPSTPAAPASCPLPLPPRWRVRAGGSPHSNAGRCLDWSVFCEANGTGVNAALAVPKTFGSRVRRPRRQVRCLLRPCKERELPKNPRPMRAAPAPIGDAKSAPSLLRRMTNRPLSWGNFPTDPPNPPRGGCRSASLLPLSNHLLPPFAPGYGQPSGSRTRRLWTTPLWGKLDLRHGFSRHRHRQRNPVTTVTKSIDTGRYFPFKARRSGPYLSPRSLDHFSCAAVRRCIKATGRALGPGCNEPSSLAARLILAGHAFWPGCRAT